MKPGKVESQVEPKIQRHRVTLLVWRAKAKPTACGTEVETGLGRPCGAGVTGDNGGKAEPNGAKGWNAEELSEAWKSVENQGDVCPVQSRRDE